MQLRTKECMYPELVGGGGRARPVAVAAEVGGRFSSEAGKFLRGFGAASLLPRVVACPSLAKGRLLRGGGWMRVGTHCARPPLQVSSRKNVST